MTYIVSSGALNSTHSLTREYVKGTRFIFGVPSRSRTYSIPLTPGGEEEIWEGTGKWRKREEREGVIWNKLRERKWGLLSHLILGVSRSPDELPDSDTAHPRSATERP